MKLLSLTAAEPSSDDTLFVDGRSMLVADCCLMLLLLLLLLLLASSAFINISLVLIIAFPALPLDDTAGVSLFSLDHDVRNWL